MSTKPKHEHEWFDEPDPSGATDTGEHGLRFECTQCGSCCTGPTGFVMFTDQEAEAMARDLKVGLEEFYSTYTRKTVLGLSLKENLTSYGYDCTFLARDEHGKAMCTVYKSRPEQCRTWPFWDSNLGSIRAWNRAAKGCPGMNKGKLYTTQHIRLTRDRVEV